MVNVEVDGELPDGVTVVGFREHVSPLGATQARDTPLLKPSTAVTLTVEVVEFPATNVPGDAGVAEIWKSGEVFEVSTINVALAL